MIYVKQLGIDDDIWSSTLLCTLKQCTFSLSKISLTDLISIEVILIWTLISTEGHIDLDKVVIIKNIIDLISTYGHIGLDKVVKNITDSISE